MESILQMLQQFGAGYTEFSQTVASQDVVCLEPSKCLLLSIADLSGNLPMMRTLAQAVVAADDDSDEDKDTALSLTPYPFHCIPCTHRCLGIIKMKM